MKLPKSYISWSQLNLWETSKQKYIDTYIHGKTPFQSKEMRFGKVFALGLDGNATLPENAPLIAKLLHSRKWRETELNVSLDDIPLKMIFDSVDTDGFDEYKTGKVPWTKEFAEKHGQLDFYALGFKIEFGFIPEIALHWIPTFQDETGIHVLGEIHTFIVEKKQEHLDAMALRIKRVVDEISNYKKFEKKTVTL